MRFYRPRLAGHGIPADRRSFAGASLVPFAHLDCTKRQEFPMALAAEIDTAQDLAPDTIEATFNYIVDDGSKVFTVTAGPGGQDVRSGGAPDPRRVVIHNGRPHAQDFALDRSGFRFVRHDTKVADFYDEAEIRRAYYPEME